MKKVTEEDGRYRCENCRKTFPDFKPTYMISAKISDFTDSIYVNFAREQGNFLMGKSASDFVKFKQSRSEDEVNEYFDSLMFKPLNLMIRGKLDQYQGNYKMRYFAIKAFDRNVKHENQSLLKRMEIYSQM